MKATDKCDIAQKEFDRLKLQQRKQMDESARRVDHLKVGQHIILENYCRILMKAMHVKMTY